jgi:putative SOS response-associated peptidase YedK
VITVPSNELVSQIHNRMPAILEPRSYDRWLSTEPDPHDLLITYPSEPMIMWPLSTRVNKPENDDPSILDRVAEAVDWQAPLDGSDHLSGCEIQRTGKPDSPGA